MGSRGVLSVSLEEGAQDSKATIDQTHGARQQAVQVVSTVYWQVDAYFTLKLEPTERGDTVVRRFAEHLALTQPVLYGFTRSNLLRIGDLSR